MRTIHCSRWLTLGLMITSWAGFADCASDSVQAQQPIRHEHIRSDMGPGVAAGHYLLSDRTLIGHVQPVQLIAPDGCVIEVGGYGKFTNAFEKKATMGMAIGTVYRFRISNLPLPVQNGTALYPSVEVIGRLNPPQGLEAQFPVQIVFSKDDLQQALAGRMVTKVIYLEDPRGNLPNKHMVDQQPNFDVNGGEDPLRAAEKLGRPMAIVRIGSRVPMANDPTETFDFGSPSPQVLPEPMEGVTFDKTTMEQLKTGATPWNTAPMAKPLSNPNVRPEQPTASRRAVNRDYQQTSAVQEQLQSSQDRVAMAARAQYEAAVLEAAKEEQIRQTAAVKDLKPEHPMPAPVVKSDTPSKEMPVAPRQPDQLNRFESR